MPLSRIIKDPEETPFMTYDFQVLQRERTTASFPGFSAKGGFFPKTGIVDSDLDAGLLDDMEAAVQNRLLELERRAQEIEEEAYTKGYAQGEKDGFEVGKKSMLIVKDRIERLLAGLEELPQRVFRDYREWLLSTSLSIARKIVGIELCTQPQALMPLIGALLDEAETHQTLTLCLNPKDLELLEKHMDLKQRSEEVQHPFNLRTDNSLERGGCRIESDIQLIDATLETRFSLLEQALRNGQFPGQD